MCESSCANERTRVYVEGIYADVTDDDETFRPRPIDRNFGDFLNAFVDYEPDDGMTIRVGRQELLYGAERLISPLDWANTRRTFEGVKLLMHEGDWNTDAFYTPPATTAYAWQQGVEPGESLLTFPSALETPHVENNSVFCRYFAARGASARKRRAAFLPRSLRGFASKAILVLRLIIPTPLNSTSS